MAVKQNNTETNANASSVSNNAQNGTGNAMPNTATANVVSNSNVVGGGVGGGVKTKMNSNLEIVEANNEHDENTVVADQCGVGLNVKPNKLNTVNTQDLDDFSDSVHKKYPSDVGHLAHVIELIEYKEQERAINLKNSLEIHHHLLVELSRIQFPRSNVEENKRVKEAIIKIGKFFGKHNDKNIYLYYLRVIWGLITDSKEPPSCALAIIFGLFDSEMIIEAVQMLLEYRISDASICHTVRLLCNWLIKCSFCQNIHLWILTILRALIEQQRHELFEDIAYDNIETAFSNVVLPLLRPKVMPVCCFLLSNVTRTPRVFHKIVPRIPKVFKFLKQQLDTKETLQNIAELVSALMLFFSGYDDLYQPVVEILKECQLEDLFGDDRVEINGQNIQHLAQFQSNAKAGLVNLGNTCYMNSVLQALANTKDFSRDILLCQSTSPLIVRMQEQIALMLYSYRNELTPTRIFKVIRPPGFAPGLQQDSSEFLSYLLETLHEQETSFRNYSSTANNSKTAAAICAKVKLENQFEMIDDNNDIENNCAGEQHGATALLNSNSTQSIVSTTSTSSTSLAIETNLSTIEKTFTGKQATTLRCLTCGCKSRNVDIFRDLQLSFPEPKNDCVANYSVQDLIDFYCSPEKLDGDNQYFCDRCKTHTDAERSVRVIKAPKNLIITLKHFKYDHKYHKRAKLMHKVFHDEKVYVKVCSTESLEEIASAHYDLYASVVHSGYSMDSGHYFTYGADASNRWFKFNDSIVTPSKAEELHNLSQPNTPYILFYQMAARSIDRNDSNTAAIAAATGGALSTQTNQIVKLEMPVPLKLEELPCYLREYVNRDNNAYNEELKMRRLKSAKTTATIATTRNIWRNDDSEDDDDRPPTTGCGGNALAFNVNRFVC